MGGVKLSKKNPKDRRRKKISIISDCFNSDERCRVGGIENMPKMV
jgi:hypothetical protein